jgi:BNR/Asp-box repeat
VVSPETAEIQDPNDPLCGSAGYLQVAAALAVGPRGEVYAVWQYGAHIDSNGVFSPRSTIAFSRSLDGGRTFDPPRHLVDINSNRANQPVAYAKGRMNDQARIAVALSGQHRGRVYVGYYQPVAPVSTRVVDQSLVSTASFLVYSDDQGATWSAPQPLGPPVPPTGVKRFWPTIAVRPGGDVEVAYLESQEVQLNPDPSVVECNVTISPGFQRAGPAVSLIDTFMVRSHDGGATFGPPLRISSQTSNWCNITFTFGTGLLSNLGDYFGLWSAGDRTFAAWPDARNGFADVFFAAVEGHGD